jgi:hypothetical protein
MLVQTVDERPSIRKASQRWEMWPDLKKNRIQNQPPLLKKYFYEEETYQKHNHTPFPLIPFLEHHIPFLDPFLVIVF